MNFYQTKTRNSRPKQSRLRQEKASSWDVVVLSFKLLFTRLQFWIQPNIWTVLFSIGLVTLPGGMAALHHTVAAGLRDPAGSEVSAFKEMKAGFARHFIKALVLSLIKWAVFAVIVVSIVFWTSRDTWPLRAVSVISFYGLVLWWLSIGYIYPILVENPELPVFRVLREALLSGFRKPFESFLFAVVSTLLQVLGIVLLGPILLVVPALRAILMIQGYWFITGKEIPGFLDIAEYARKKYDIES